MLGVRTASKYLSIVLYLTFTLQGERSAHANSTTIGIRDASLISIVQRSASIYFCVWTLGTRVHAEANGNMNLQQESMCSH